MSRVERWKKKVKACFTYQINISRSLLQITFVSVWVLPRVIPYLFLLLFMAYVLTMGYVPRKSCLEDARLTMNLQVNVQFHPPQGKLNLQASTDCHIQQCNSN